MVSGPENRLSLAFRSNVQEKASSIGTELARLEKAFHHGGTLRRQTTRPLLEEAEKDL